MNIKTAKQLQQLRKKHGYSQEELADLLKVSRQAVSKWERAEASPDTDNLIAIAKLYGITIDELINDSDTQTEASEQAIKSGTPRNEIKDDECDRNDYCEPLSPQQKIIMSIVGGCTVLIASIAFLTIGLCLNIWHPTWLVYLLIPIVPSIADAIIKKNASHFALPVLIAAIYMLVGFLTGLWHPTWVIFLAIPLYYVVADGVKLAKTKKEQNNNINNEQ